MNLYLAAIYSNNLNKGGRLYAAMTPIEQAARNRIPHILESYHYVSKDRAVREMRDDGAKVFLDSGAFSAHTQGVQIDLPGYCNYIKKNIDIVRHDDGVMLASVLDGIGDPLKTWQNQQAMESLGVRPLPCFHYGEDDRYLEWYIERYPYITLGGMVPISTPNLIIWLDRIWNKYLTDGSGRPRIKVHGFGLTTIHLMERYPWFSVDSSSWVQMASFGSILIPGGKNIQIHVSESSPQRKNWGQHIDAIPQIQRDAIKKKVADAGFDIERMREHYLPRWAFNCWSFVELNDIVNKSRAEGKYTTSQQSLF